MQWWEVSFTVNAEATEAVSALIQDWPEVQGISMEGAMAAAPAHPEYGEWFDESVLSSDTVHFLFYMPEHVPQTDIRDRLGDVFARVREAGLTLDTGETNVDVRMIDEASWEASWKSEYQPIQVGQRIIIVPHWLLDETDNPDGRIPILLEPGMAFGTGTHQTTQLCLQALEQLGVEDKRVLDIGCGTAVLAIAAAKLGAKDVLAIDIDPVAVTVAQENVEENGVAAAVAVRQGDLLTALADNEAPYDIAIANILRDVVIELAPQAADRVKPGGVLLASGFVASQVDAVAHAFLAAGFDVAEQRQMDDWILLMGVRRS